jgi:PAS domain S-box-containing protein
MELARISRSRLGADQVVSSCLGTCRARRRRLAATFPGGAAARRRTATCTTARPEPPTMPGPRGGASASWRPRSPASGGSSRPRADRRRCPTPCSRAPPTTRSSRSTPRAGSRAGTRAPSASSAGARPRRSAWTAALTFTPEDRERGAPERERAAAAAEGRAEDERWHVRKDGGRFRASGLLLPLRGAAGPGFLKVMRDVTGRALAEERLRASEELFRQFGEASSDVLWVRDADTLRFEYVSPAFEAVYGVGRGRVPGDGDGDGGDLARWASLIVPEDRGAALGNIARVRAGERVTHEFRVARPSDGKVRWIRDTSFPILDEAGRVRRVGGIGRDVTGRGRPRSGSGGSRASSTTGSRTCSRWCRRWPRRPCWPAARPGARGGVRGPARRPGPRARPADLDRLGRRRPGRARGTDAGALPGRRRRGRGGRAGGGAAAAPGGGAGDGAARAGDQRGQVRRALGPGRQGRRGLGGGRRRGRAASGGCGWPGGRRAARRCGSRRAGGSGPR